MSGFALVSRRELLHRGSRAVLVMGALAIGCRPGESESQSRDALVSLALEVRGAGALGTAYLEGSPDEARPEALVSILLEGVPPPLAAARESLAPRLHARHRRDFETGNVIEVDGWILGRTEARLYALASLLVAR
jgi:hypothetical protein